MQKSTPRYRRLRVEHVQRDDAPEPEAVRELRAILSEGPQSVSSCFNQLRSQGFLGREVWTAARDLGLVDRDFAGYAGEWALREAAA